MSELAIQERSRDGVAVLELRGDLDGRAQQAFDVAWTEAVATEPTALILHFGEVGYVNSTGIALVVGLLAKARAAGIPLLAVGLSDHYRHIFEITRLADFMTIAASEDEAMESRTAPA